PIRFETPDEDARVVDSPDAHHRARYGVAVTDRLAVFFAKHMERALRLRRVKPAGRRSPEHRVPARKPLEARVLSTTVLEDPGVHEPHLERPSLPEALPEPVEVGPGEAAWRLVEVLEIHRSASALPRDLPGYRWEGTVRAHVLLKQVGLVAHAL